MQSKKKKKSFKNIVQIGNLHSSSTLKPVSIDLREGTKKKKGNQTIPAGQLKGYSYKTKKGSILKLTATIGRLAAKASRCHNNFSS